MPSLKDATQPRDTSNLVPLVSAPSQAPPVLNASADPEFSALALAPIPPVLGTDTDAARQFYRGGVSQIRMSPLPIQSKIAAGAAASSNAIAVVAAAVGTGAISLGMPSIFAVAGSPAELGGGFVVSLVPELANTVFAGPPEPSGSVTVDGFNSNTGATSNVTTGDVTTTAANDFCISAFIDPNPNARTLTGGGGWTQDENSFIQYSGSPTSSFHILTQHRFEATPSVVDGSGNISQAENWAAVLACFSPLAGYTPAILQLAAGPVSNINTAASQTATFANPTSMGSTIVVVWTITGTGTYTITDSQGNSYTTVVSVANSLDNAAQIAISYAPVITPGSTTVTLTSVSAGATSMTLIIYEVSNLQNLATSAIPTFRHLVLADLPAGIEVNFSGLLGGTNVNALVIGSGGSLVASGGGVIAATSVGGITVTGTPTSGQVLTATSGTAADWQTPGGGGGGSSAGAAIWPQMPGTVASDNTGNSGYSVIWRMPATFLMNACSTWRFGFCFAPGAGSIVVGGMEVIQATAGTTTIITSVPVTIGSSLTPSLTGSGSFMQFTDTISLAVNASYDYYFAIYYTSGTVNFQQSSWDGNMPYSSFEQSGNQLTAWASALPGGISGSSTVYGNPIALVVS